ncbi:hypothetical protein [Halobaculum marinum]|uniref:DoxX-like family protein n=1 Tax=Halobaculum marinum TaxID=3031996 RepID=A0ABD5WZM5_9EURY|nr:hypothetical protein [Halobaculum sp. DT55]
MLRSVFTAILAPIAVAPDASVAWGERLALDNPDECERRSWVVPGARLEAVVFLAMLWRSDASYSAFKRLLGIVGLLVFLAPRAYVDRGGGLAYASEPTPQWKPWVYRATRLIGVVYLLVGANELRRGE